MARGKKTDQKKTATATETAERTEATAAPEAAEQTEDTAAKEAAEQTEDTAPTQEAAEQTGEATDATETQEQEEDTTHAQETPERDILAGIQNPCVYCGPTVRGVARQYTTFQGGIPDALRDFIKEHPDARQLIVSTAQFPAYRRRLDTPGTEEAKLYKRVKEQL